MSHRPAPGRRSGACLRSVDRGGDDHHPFVAGVARDAGVEREARRAAAAEHGVVVRKGCLDLGHGVDVACPLPEDDDLVARVQTIEEQERTLQAVSRQYGVAPGRGGGSVGLVPDAGAQGVAARPLMGRGIAGPRRRPRPPPRCGSPSCDLVPRWRLGRGRPASLGGSRRRSPGTPGRLRSRLRSWLRWEGRARSARR